MQEHSLLTILDGVILIFVFLSAILAMARGFTREFLGIASFIAAAFCAYFTARPLSPVFSFIDFTPVAGIFKVSIDTILTVVAGIFVFVVMWIILTIASHWVSEAVKDSAVNPIDRTFGFVYGTFRGYILVCGLFIGYSLVTGGREYYNEMVLRSRTIPLLEDGSQILLRFLPDDIEEKFNAFSAGQASVVPNHTYSIPENYLSNQINGSQKQPNNSNIPQNKNATPINNQAQPQFNLLKIENSLSQSGRDIKNSTQQKSSAPSLDDIINRAKQ